MAENQISLESIVQRSKQHLSPAEHQTIILVTHATTEDSVRKAVDAIKTEGYLVGEPQVIRIERPKTDS
jgi:homoserine dehydrogenase